MKKYFLIVFFSAFSVFCYAGLPLLYAAAVYVEPALVAGSGWIVRKAGADLIGKGVAFAAANDSLFTVASTAFSAGSTSGGGILPILSFGLLGAISQDIDEKNIIVDGVAITPKYDVELKAGALALEPSTVSYQDLTNSAFTDPYYFYDGEEFGSNNNPIKYNDSRLLWYPLNAEELGNKVGNQIFVYTPSKTSFSSLSDAVADYVAFCNTNNIPVSITYDDISYTSCYDTNSNYACDSVSYTDAQNATYKFAGQTPYVRNNAGSTYLEGVTKPELVGLSTVSKNGIKEYKSVEGGWIPDPNDLDWTPEEKAKYGTKNNLKFGTSDNEQLQIFKTDQGITLVSTRNLTSTEQLSHPDATDVVRSIQLDPNGVLIEVSESFVTATSPDDAVAKAPNIDIYPNSVVDNSSNTSATSPSPTSPSSSVSNTNTTNETNSLLTSIKDFFLTSAALPTDPVFSDNLLDFFYKDTFSNLKALRLPASDNCPTANVQFDFFGQNFDLNFSHHCNIANENRSIMSNTMIVIFIISALFIVLRA